MKRKLMKRSIGDEKVKKNKQMNGKLRYNSVKQKKILRENDKMEKKTD